MPWRSYSLPTMKPVMFCRNTIGTRFSLQSVKKCAPFNELSLNSTPLFARIPIL
jgi:hypothetical protein